MPSNQAQWITHVIEGGWATDYGKNLYASPQNGELRIPWLKTCENAKFYPDGSWGKHPGLFSLVSTPINAPRSSSGIAESSQTRFIYDYVRMGSSLYGTRKRVGIVGSFLYDLTDLDTYTQIGDLVPYAYYYDPHLTTFNDLLIIGNGSTPKSWDQTTFQSLAGTPPAFSFSTHHAGRHWAAGNLSNSSRLYYSAVGNPEDWVGAGSGSIDIDPGDGDAITAILSWKRELWVFKGPYRLSIHRITGTSPSDFTRTTFINGVSAAGQQSIFQYGNDFGFWSPRGSCHSLMATDTYGDYEQAYINYPILSWCRNPANLSNGSVSSSWQTVTDTLQNVTYSVLNNTPALLTFPENSITLAFDWKFRNQENPYPRISKFTMGQFCSVGLSHGVLDNTQLFPIFGGWNGKFYQEQIPALAGYVLDEIRETTGSETDIPYRIETPALSYGPQYYKKSITAVSADIVDNTGRVKNVYGTLNLAVGGRGYPTQTVQFSNKGFVGLDSFTLDLDQLGDLGDSPNFTEAVSGESTALTFTLTSSGTVSQGVTPDVRVNHFSAFIQPSGASMENF